VGQRTAALTAWFAAVLACAGAVAAAPIVDLGPPDAFGFALDQPRVDVWFYRAGTSLWLGPESYTSFVLDTGANGLLAGEDAVDEMQGYGYQTDGRYYEQGVAGGQFLDVSELLDAEVVGSDSLAIEMLDLRILSSPDLDLGGFGGIIGMPAMVGRVIDWDLAAFPTDWLMGTHFLAEVPPPAPQNRRYTLDLQLVPFEQTGKEHPDDPNLTWAPLPFLTGEICSGPYRVRGQFVLDSGASLSFISTATAVALGLDTNHNGVIEYPAEAVDELDIGGVGGSLTVPLVVMDQIRLATREGPWLRWTEPLFAVVEIPGLDAVVGMELFTSGWFDEETFIGDNGFLDHVYLDFRQADALRGAACVDVRPDSNRLRLLPPDQAPSYDLLDLALFSQHWLRDDCTDACGGADFDADGDVDLADLLVLEQSWLAPPAEALGNPPYDLLDLAFFSRQWLRDDCTDACGGADFDADGDVDLADLLVLAQNWLIPPAVPPESP